VRLALAAVALAFAGCADATTLASASCSDHADQAAAQKAADTADGDGDGVYCETLPCPCAGQAAATGSGASTRARVDEVVDGDTLHVLTAGGERRTVRLIGIDTPETKKPDSPVECGGEAASSHMRRLAPPGRRVTLTADPTQDAVDRYGRLLAYVSTGGRTTLQERQLAAGHAKVYVFERPFRRLRRFRAAERRARAAGRGAWSACGADF
jgi:endonuclease YncB( thermonuclease family)